jgi:hypothetical protein
VAVYGKAVFPYGPTPVSVSVSITAAATHNMGDLLSSTLSVWPIIPFMDHYDLK